MTHRNIMQAAASLVADAEHLHPNDRVKQAVYIMTRPGFNADAYVCAITDTAFCAVFNEMTDEETQVWAIWNLYDDVRPLADARLAGRRVYHANLKVAA